MSELVQVRSLQELESIISKGIASFIETGLALAEIRDHRLYREQGFGTFEEYCQKRWAMGRHYVNRQIAAAGVVENLVPMGTKPLTERQARELTRLTPEQQREIAASIDFSHTTAAQIRDRVQMELRIVKPEGGIAMHLSSIAAGLDDLFPVRNDEDLRRIADRLKPYGLSRRQLAAVGAEIWEQISADAQQYRAGAGRLDRRLRDIVGDAVGANGGLVEEAFHTLKLSRPLFEKIQRGEMSPSAAYKQAQAERGQPNPDAPKTKRRPRPTDRNFQAARNRMIEALSLMLGMSEALAQWDVNVIAPGLKSESEKRTFVKDAQTIATRLSKFARRLETAYAQKTEERRTTAA